MATSGGGGGGYWPGYTGPGATYYVPSIFDTSLEPKKEPETPKVMGLLAAAGIGWFLYKAFTKHKTNESEHSGQVHE